MPDLTRQLKQAQKEGARIIGPNGETVTWRPARNRDYKPWVATDGPNTDQERFPARQCRAVTPNGGGPWSVARLLKI